MKDFYVDLELKIKRRIYFDNVENINKLLNNLEKIDGCVYSLPYEFHEYIVQEDDLYEAQITPLKNSGKATSKLCTRDGRLIWDNVLFRKAKQDQAADEEGIE